MSFPRLRKASVYRDVGREALTPFVQAEFDSLLSAAERANVAAMLDSDVCDDPCIFGLLRLRVSHVITYLTRMSLSEKEQF